jgi:hypothetical protein
MGQHMQQISEDSKYILKKLKRIHTIHEFSPWITGKIFKHTKYKFKPHKVLPHLLLIKSSFRYVLLQNKKYK